MEAVLHETESARLITRGWSVAGPAIDRIRINRLEKVTREGRPAWLKTRKSISRCLIPVANLFFQLAGNPVEVLASGPEWIRRETEMFRLVNGSGRLAGPAGTGAFYSEALPGEDLVCWLKSGRMETGIFSVVGESFRRFHELTDPATGGFFTHGDPHLGNLLFHAGSGRVYLIDFETRHLPDLPLVERRADDLLVFLQDLLGRTSEGDWREFSGAFLRGYGEAGVLGCLQERLQLPQGFSRIWWANRTSWLPRVELARRLEILRSEFPT